MGHESAQSGKRITFAARNTHVRTHHSNQHVQHKAVHNNPNRGGVEIEAAIKLIENEEIAAASAVMDVAVGSADAFGDVAIWSADALVAVGSEDTAIVRSAEIAAATVESDVAVGTGTDNRLGSEGMGDG